MPPSAGRPHASLSCSRLDWTSGCSWLAYSGRPPEHLALPMALHEALHYKDWVRADMCISSRNVSEVLHFQMTGLS